MVVSVSRVLSITRVDCPYQQNNNIQTRIRVAREKLPRYKNRKKVELGRLYQNIAKGGLSAAIDTPKPERVRVVYMSRVYSNREV